MKKLLLSTTFLSLAACAVSAENKNETDEKPELPNIIRVFACSDNCPGPREKYMVDAYEGIKTAEECNKLGGVPMEFYGWGRFFVCKVKK